MVHVLLATAAFHDKSKVPFFIAAGVLVAWVVLVSLYGIRTTFPASKVQGRGAVVITAVLIIVTAALAVATARTPPGAQPYNTGVVTDGQGPALTPVSAVAPPTSGPIALSADPSGELKFNTNKLTTTSTHVVIVFTNKSPLGHNVTIANAAGKVLGATPTFAGGSRTLSLTLPAGTYTYYCSVPGHEQAGMKGTLTVTPSSTSTGPTSSGSTSTSGASGQLALAANPTGLLAFSTTTLTATSTHVVIVFTNKSPVPHNVTIANAAGKVLGATPTFAGGSRTLSLTLPAGTYTYYCSVPGHEQAGMKGTLTVTPSSTSTGPTSSGSTSTSGASGQLALAANPTGLLAFSTTTLTATSTHVVIVFTNKSPVPHNVTIANAAGKVLGATPTFAGGSRTLSLTLPAGTYTYYCSVPGHEQAGMKGTLTVH